MGLLPKKNFQWELALHEPSGQWQLRSGREVGWFAAVRIHNATQGCCEGICGLKQAYATPISSFLFISTHTYCKYLGFLSSLQQRTKNGQYSAIVKLRYRQRHDYCSCFPSLWDNKSQNFIKFPNFPRHCQSQDYQRTPQPYPQSTGHLSIKSDSARG